MAQYKVPQDVEAEDKLLGPFTFRQFIYLLIAAIGIAGAWGLYQIFPLLAIIPIPFSFFFGILALPIKKDQPMETYLAAIISFYLKPNRHIWTAGQRESTIKITAPKTVEKPRTRNITEDEASHRLSFLANIVDTEGYAIRGESLMQDEYAAEANTIEDVLEQKNPIIDQMIANEQRTRKAELVREMQTAVKSPNPTGQGTIPQPQPNTQFVPRTPATPQTPVTLQAPGANYQPANPQPVQPPAQPAPQQFQPTQPAQPPAQPARPQPTHQTMPMPPVLKIHEYQPPVTLQAPGANYQPANSQPTRQPITQASLNQAAMNKQLQDLANNNAFSVQTIAEQAKRIQNQANSNNFST